MRVRAFHAVVMLVFLSMSAALGCEMKGDAVKPRVDAPSQPGVWQIKPTALRVYPSTRFVQYEEQLALEARVEFVDAMGDTIKAVGNLRFEVFAANRDGEVADQKRLFSWDVPMLTMEANQEFYDAVTRAYLFRLGINSLPKDLERAVVRVIYMPARGDRMEAMAVVRVQ